MKKHRWIVDRSYREEIRERHPKLFTSEGGPVLRLISYVMTTRNINDLGLRISSEEVLRDVDEDHHPPHNKRFAADWVAYASTIIPGISFTGYGDIGPRCIKTLGIRPQSIAEKKSKDTVEWLSGKRVSEVLQEVKEDEQKVSSIFDAQNVLLEYLNNPSRTTCWASVKKTLHTDRLYLTAEAIESERSRAIAENSINTLKFDIVPQYAPSRSGRTHRLFTTNNNWSWIPRVIRDVMLEGQVQCDLRMAHLAIAASQWNVKEAFDILDMEDPWAEVQRLTGISDKSLLKQLIYTIVYGGGRNMLGKVMMEAGIKDVKAMLGRFTGVSLIITLLEKRDAALSEVEAAKGIRDTFGQWHPLTEKATAKSLLALRAQSIEMALLLPALQVVKGRDRDSRITVWLHDGFYLWTRFKAQGPKDAAKMKKLVDAEAKKRGIPTRLEVK
jgi:hypothetical protein